MHGWLVGRLHRHLRRRTPPSDAWLACWTTASAPAETFAHSYRHGWLVGRIVKLRLVITLAFFALKNAQNIFLCRESYLKPPVTDCFDGILLH